MKNRISAKVLSFVLAIALVFASAPLSIAAEDKSFSIATISDIHYYTEELAGDKKEAFYTYLDAANCVYDDLDAIIDAAFESLKYEVQNNGIKHIVVTGDLTTNGEYESHIALSEKFKAFEEATGANLYVCAGNHDINNSKASSFVNNKKESARITTPTEFSEIYNEFGFKEAYHTFSDFDANIGGALSYSVKTGDGARLIIADGGKFTSDITASGNDEHETAGTFSEELIQWILDEAKDAKKDGEIPLLFTHWNMNGMNYFHEFLLQGFVIDDNYILQELFADNGINYAFSGHQHVNDTSVTYSDAGNPMYSVITPTLTQFPYSYRITEFTKNSKNGLDVTFDMKSVDEYSGVKNLYGDANYPTPYRTTGFMKQFGGKADPANYVFAILKSTLDKYVNDIRAQGSIVKYIEKEMDIDIERLVDDFLFGGIKFEGTTILAGENVMSFLNDLDAQLMTKYIYRKAETYNTINSILHELMDLKVSEIPCTKFISTYGFGDTEKGGTLGDVVLSVLAYMYGGNEDISDDPFMKDFVEFTGKIEFVDFLLDNIKKYIVDDLLIDNILANIDFNIDSLFVDKTATVGGFVQMLYALLINFLDSGIFTGDISDLSGVLYKLLSGFGDVSLKKLVDAVLGTGLISYGKNTDELVESLINQFIPLEVKEAAVYQAKIVIGGMVQDSTKDYGVTYSFNGAEKIAPTKEDMQLPVNVTLSMTEDNSTSFTVSWFTKYSVTNTDIEVEKKGAKFSGKADVGDNIKAVTQNSTYKAYGFDAGTLGILPWERQVVKHTVTVSGLAPDTEYIFRIGDFSKGYTADGTVKTAPNAGEKFSFVHITDSAAMTPAQYETLKNTLDTANKVNPDFEFIAHTGNLTTISENNDQVLFAVNAAEKYFSSKKFAYAPGSSDLENGREVSKFFDPQNVPQQMNESGTYYSYDYGNAHFIVLNTNALLSGGTLSKEQTAWLKADLENSKGEWNIVLMHQSIYGNDTSSQLHSQIKNLMGEYNIDLILQGSEGAYIRTTPVNNEGVPSYKTKNVKVDGTNYITYSDYKGAVAVVGATSGDKLESITPDGEIYASSKETANSVFSMITIEGNMLTLTAYEVQGTNAVKIDSFAIDNTYSNILHGDVDFDGRITANDARLTLRAAVNLEKLEGAAFAAADADSSGKISAEDARTILRASVSLHKFSPSKIRW